MFIRKPYEDTIQFVGDDDSLDYEVIDINSFGERIFPPFFPPGGQNNGGPGPAPPTPPFPYQQGPGPAVPPSKDPNSPPPPPPKATPKAANPNQLKVSSGSIRPCRYQYVYVWLNNGRSFWVWPTNIDRRTLSGYRWNGFRWVYFGIDLNRIAAFECFGRNVVQKEDNLVPYIKTQKLSPDFINIEYPFIKGSSNEDASNIINEEIIDELNSLLLTEVLVPEKVDFLKVDNAYEIPLNAYGILSIVMSLSTLVKGQMKGRTTFASLTTDINTGKKYAFEDLFNPNIDYKTELNSIIKKKLSDMDVNLIAPYEGITEDQRFYLTPVDLVLYYQPDEYTASESGLFRISIPYTEIEGILADNSPLKNFLT